MTDIGSIATVLEPGASDVARLVEARRATATITFDPNTRPTVVDTVGAGDTVMGALLDVLIDADLIGADRRQALRDVPLGVLESIMRRSADAAAVTAARSGADPPTRAELAAV
ncbi:hypothetical protein E3O42_13300 [Cryobacterium adonitolivorans]|uniref:Uncharacterized protein n=1 Tax=Cryobacterium adonitolivorans TaxID=1259189 RepID=A0A4R8W4J3_9MICO|nr:PfkB family carbohydrate kinase [Cryobacterium adonitolivorans]TFB99527.1 hypothetical protein E3O42_13300 [Cryobacterium adonitolivorans]